MKYVLRGTVVTLDSKKRVIKDGRVGIDGNKIAFVRSSRYRLPDGFQDSPVVEVEGFIYPGLIDLHNHLAYNFLGLWKISKKFVTRYQWSGTARYNREITAPMKLLASTCPVELVKYAEVKALVGGTTTIAGFAKFNKSYATWLLRNVEAERFGEQEPKIYTSVLKLREGKQFLDTERKMREGNAFLYHLAEGTSPKLHAEYDELDSHRLISDKLVAIHCTALAKGHFKSIGKKKTKIVWSPLSNFLLYGATTDVSSAKKHGTLVCLGSDWSPSGSKSLLWELKAVDLVNKESLNRTFSHRDIVEMAITNPARAIGWDDRVGMIKPGYHADLVVFERIEDDPYPNLVLSTEKGLNLSIVDGRPRYGDLELLSNLGIDKPETITVQNRKKGLDILEPGMEHGEVTFRLAVSKLKETLSRPADAARKLFDDFKRMKAGDVPLRLIPLEEEEEVNRPLSFSAKTYGPFMADNFADMSTPRPTGLDSLVTDKDFFKDLEENPNIPSYLKNLKQYA